MLKAKARRARKPDPEATRGEDIISMDEAIALLKTTRATFYRWLKSGRLKGMKAGRQWRFRRADVKAFMSGEEPRSVVAGASLEALFEQLNEAARKAGRKAFPAEGERDIVHAVSLIIQLANEMRASDIHLTAWLEKGEEMATARICYRIDGQLHSIATLEPRTLQALVERVKVLAACDPHEKRKPQDGRITVRLNGDAVKGGRSLDIRVSFVPALFGEIATMRVLAKDAVSISLDRIPFAPEDRKRIDQALALPWGLIVCTGPTGSGKTTVLYSCLNQITKPELKVMSVEHPVEYALPGITQIQVTPSLGYTQALRSVLRSDPDVIMLGEIQDRDSAQIAMEATLTGHLVLTTLHTEDATGALRRLVDIGLDPFVVAECVKLVIAQRLVRQLCPKCAKKDLPPEHQLEETARLVRTGGLDWNHLAKNFMRPSGCTHCRMIGYRGRRPIAETLTVTPEIAAALVRGASNNEMRTLAIGQGFTSLAADGIRRAAAGETTLSEVLRFTHHIGKF